LPSASANCPRKYSNTKPKTPGLAEGGTVIGEGSVLVGEKGPEILSMKPGATVTPLNKTNAATIVSPSAPQQPKQQAIDYDRLEKIFNVNLDMDGVNFARL
jgi:hypothetical protein